MYYLGSNNLLFYKIKFKVTFPCNFKLQRYPFGPHVCNVSFSLRERKRNMLFEERPSTLLNYRGSDDLLEFKLTKVTFQTLYQITEDVRSSIVLSLHLRTQSEFHILNSFAPSALMFFIVLSTLFYPVSDFNERIMVSLTALLVLAALFTQASSSSVKTPYYKLLDVWYAALILLCFIVVIVNASVHSLRQKKGGSVKVSPMLGQIHYDQSYRRAVICNLVSKIVVIILFLSLVTLFVLFSVDLI
ncbi:glutamate-gated chloride channel alpha-like [Panulirus ornatus]|uniref:glutamate-gated chloride channel alpha-like n=1 Tax=Panulirus ornatus TaxID=150431 RepID=UPI003A877BA9